MTVKNAIQVVLMLKNANMAEFLLYEDSTDQAVPLLAARAAAKPESFPNLICDTSIVSYKFTNRDKTCYKLLRLIDTIKFDNDRCTCGLYKVRDDKNSRALIYNSNFKYGDISIRVFKDSKTYERLLSNAKIKVITRLKFLGIDVAMYTAGTSSTERYAILSDSDVEIDLEDLKREFSAAICGKTSKFTN